MSRFVHLGVHSEYSLVDSIVRIARPKDAKDSPHAYLVEAVAEAGMGAVAISDESNLFAMVKFYQAAVAKGIKPILGADLHLAEEASPRITLLCQNETGLKNLSELLTRAYMDAERNAEPVVSREQLAGFHQGLIVLSGAREGDIGRALLRGKQKEAQQLLAFWDELFPGRYYLELQRTGRPDEEFYIDAALSLAEQAGMPVVATNAVRFIRREDFEAHEARVCIQQGRRLNDPRRPRAYSEQQYLRSSEEMEALFPDVPEAIENTVEIAKRCNLALRLGESVLPDFPIPEGMTTEAYFRAVAQDGLNQRLKRIDVSALDPKRETHQVRLARELDVIIGMKFPGYFLIVADFVRWAKENGVPVGPGRGSGAGSLVAYAMGITDLDPLQYDLLFERFLNPERVSMPDFDIDFCMDGRDRVIDYVASRYGRDHVSQIITYGSMAARAVVRDCGRVLGHGYGFVDRIAKLIPFEIGMTLEKALKDEPELREEYEKEEEVRAILDMARALEGLARNAGKHAGGVVIAPSRLTDFTPLYCEAGGKSLVTQLDKDDVEAIGLVKFDFLGLRTLTIIDRAVRHIREVEGVPLEIDQLPLDDKAAYDLIKAQKTTAVFQLESRGIREIIKRLAPDRFGDIVALVALYRPGPLQSGMVEDFIERKHGRAQVSYFHPDLEPILKPTYGVILYQEQVMQIAQVLAGYSLGEADLLRRAMGKKKPEEMAKQREIFLTGAAKNQVDPKLAETLFDLMEKFAGYGFNKSHSVAYALLAYQTAWLKANHPAAFMAAVLSADMDHTDKIVNLVDECRDMRLKLVPPDINRSAYWFGALDRASSLLYGLGAIKGVGQAVIDNLTEERESAGPFQSLDELCLRCGAQKLNKRALEALIKGGALDSFGESRAGLMERLPEALKVAEQAARDQEAGQVDLFGDTALAEPAQKKRSKIPEWDETHRLTAEREALGLYLTGHPVTRYADELKAMCGGRIADIRQDDAAGQWGSKKATTVRIAGLLIAVRIRNGATGKSAFLTLDDRSARMEVALFSDEFQQYSALIKKDEILVAEGGLSYDEFAGAMRLRVRRLMSLDEARLQYARRLELNLATDAIDENFTPRLGSLLKESLGGNCRLIATYRSNGCEGLVAFDDVWTLRPSEQLIGGLRALPGVESAEFRYS